MRRYGTGADQYLHPERVGDFCNGFPDAAKADDGQGFPCQFHGRVGEIRKGRGGAPLALPHVQVIQGQLAEMIQHESKYQLCHGVGGVTASVADPDAPGGSGRNVHIVVAGGEQPDILQIGACFYNFSGNRHLVAQHQLCVPDPGGSLPGACQTVAVDLIRKGAEAFRGKILMGGHGCPIQNHKPHAFASSSVLPLGAFFFARAWSMHTVTMARISITSSNTPMP